MTLAQFRANRTHFFHIFFEAFGETIKIWQALPPRLHPVNAPKSSFFIKKWRYYLRFHHNQAFADYVIKGLADGFRIGRTSDRTPDKVSRNLPTAEPNKEKIMKWIGKSLINGHFIGPFEISPFEGAPWSPIGAVDKDGGRDKRVIHHLSAPRWGVSVNSEISPPFNTIKYLTFQDVVLWVKALGKNAFLWKIDLSAAYRQFPIHPIDWKFLGIKWYGRYAYDTRLPFGLTSSCYIFTQITDALTYITQLKAPALFKLYLFCIT